jgi:hypothetical protein
VQLSVHELTESEYPLWDELAAVSPQRTIFTQRWWMEIVTQGQVRLLGCFQGDCLVGGLPIWTCQTLGVRRLRQPPLSPYWGPLLRPLEGKALTQINTEMHVMRALAEALSPWADIAMLWHHSLVNWLPFYWNNFTQTTRYTYRLPDLSDLLRIAKSRHDSVGQQLRRAERDGLHIVDMVDADVVAQLNRLSMAHQGANHSDGLQRVWPALAKAAGERQCLFTTAAMDADDHVHAAMAMVWDDRCAYGIVNGADRQFRNSYGTTMTMWREIEYAATEVPEFDFEGSTVESVEQFYRRFGGQLTRYMLVTRTASTRLNVVRTLYKYFQHGGNRPKKSAIRKPVGADVDAVAPS